MIMENTLLEKIKLRMEMAPTDVKKKEETGWYAWWTLVEVFKYVESLEERIKRLERLTELDP